MCWHPAEDAERFLTVVLESGPNNCHWQDYQVDHRYRRGGCLVGADRSSGESVNGLGLFQAEMEYQLRAPAVGRQKQMYGKVLQDIGPKERALGLSTGPDIEYLSLYQ